MSGPDRARGLENRLRMLEIEAAVQRAALVATLAAWEERRTLAWGGSLARLGMKALSVPRVRWLLIATAISRLQRRKQSRTQERES